MTCISPTNNLMVASITLPKESTKPGSTSSDGAVSRDPQRRQASAIKRGRLSTTPQKDNSTTMKTVSCSSSLPTNYPRNNQASPSLFNYQNLNVYVVGKVGHPKAQIVRVVHISDTRGVGDYYANSLPNGHILIHSGDFLDGPPLRRQPTPHRSCFRRSFKKDKSFLSSPASSTSSPSTGDCDWKAKLCSINEFFRRQPHPYKIFVSGCWDYLGPERPTAAQIQKHLSSAIYLEDAACEILGLKVYGIPWTSADDLRPEDGKSHLISSLASSTRTSKVKAMLPKWLFRSPTSWSQGHRQAKRQRCLSSSTGNSTTAQSNIWPAYQNSDTCNGSCCSSTTHAKASPGESASSPVSSSSYSSASSTNSSASASALPISDGFILPDIKAVEERYARVPSGTNIIVSHMPAWRPELYTHVVERVQPYLHLCGHDFTGYGVTWRRGVVFSNAAVQLTANYPRLYPQNIFPRRRKAYSSTFSSSSGVGVVSGSRGEVGEGDASTASGDLFGGTSATSQVTDPEPDSLEVTRGINTLPPRISRFTDVGTRPRRWRRRLSSVLGRLSLLLSAHSLSDAPRTPYMTVSNSYNIGANNIKPTPSSLAAMRSGDGDFVVDPTLSVFGSNGGGGGAGGGSRSGYTGRRNPLVFDVYVVIEEGVNDREVLPDYTETSAGHSEPPPKPSHRPRPQTLRRNRVCCVQ